MQLGRNVDELIRIFEGLQTIDRNDVSVPANWKLETWYLARKDFAGQGR
jgi:alkyl hydroperoxide reductase subunit AhpC